MTTLADVLREHTQIDCWWKCDGGASFNTEQYIAHVVDAVAAAGLVVVQLPKPDERGVWVDSIGGEFHVHGNRVGTPDGTVDIWESRMDAAVRLAAAAAAEAVAV